MRELAAGGVLSLVVNGLTVVGWLYMGPWWPSVGNVLLVLTVTMIYGLEDRWAFPLGYWAIELLSIAIWLMGVGPLLQRLG